MKNAAIIGFATVVAMLAVFFGFAFVMWQANPSYWSADTRAFCISVMFLAGILVAALTADNI